MRHSELSLSDAFRYRDWQSGRNGLHTWESVVRDATEPCLMLNRAGLVSACSSAAADLLVLPGAESALGRALLDGVLEPVDFTASGDRLADWELARLPPLRALATGVLARGLVRFRGAGRLHTVDAVSTPLRDKDGGAVIGSLTFFAAI